MHEETELEFQDMEEEFDDEFSENIETAGFDPEAPNPIETQIDRLPEIKKAVKLTEFKINRKQLVKGLSVANTASNSMELFEQMVVISGGNSGERGLLRFSTTSLSAIATKQYLLDTKFEKEFKVAVLLDKVLAIASKLSSKDITLEIYDTKISLYVSESNSVEVATYNELIPDIESKTFIDSSNSEDMNNFNYADFIASLKRINPSLQKFEGNFVYISGKSLLYMSPQGVLESVIKTQNEKLGYYVTTVSENIQRLIKFLEEVPSKEIELTSSYYSLKVEDADQTIKIPYLNFTVKNEDTKSSFILYLSAVKTSEDEIMKIKNLFKIEQSRKYTKVDISKFMNAISILELGLDEDAKTLTLACENKILMVKFSNKFDAAKGRQEIKDCTEEDLPDSSDFDVNIRYGIYETILQSIKGKIDIELQAVDGGDGMILFKQENDIGEIFKAILPFEMI